MSSNDEIVETKKAADNILEMLKEAGVSTESLVEKRHAFWDTQVSSMSRLFLSLLEISAYIVLYCIVLSIYIICSIIS